MKLRVENPPDFAKGWDKKRPPYNWDAGEPFDDPPREPNHYVPIDTAMRAFHRGMIAGAVIEAALIIAGITLFYWMF